MENFNELGLSEKTLGAVARLGYEAPTPVQEQAIPLVLEGRDIARHLDGACEAVLMACTLGAESERALRLRTATSPTDALLYGAAASALVEAAADAEESRIVAEAAARGLRTNFRYSPGFGDLPLAVQPAFLAALDAPRRIERRKDCLLYTSDAADEL